MGIYTGSCMVNIVVFEEKIQNYICTLIVQYYLINYRGSSNVAIVYPDTSISGQRDTREIISLSYNILMIYEFNK